MQQRRARHGIEKLRRGGGRFSREEHLDELGLDDLRGPALLLLLLACRASLVRALVLLALIATFFGHMFRTWPRGANTKYEYKWELMYLQLLLTKRFLTFAFAYIVL